MSYAEYYIIIGVIVVGGFIVVIRRLFRPGVGDHDEYDASISTPEASIYLGHVKDVDVAIERAEWAIDEETEVD